MSSPSQRMLEAGGSGWGRRLMLGLYILFLMLPLYWLFA